MKNTKSIRGQLYNLAKKEQIDFQMIITRFLHEHVLLRISNSKWKDSLFLKGGNLMYAIYGLTSRPTIDIDLLGCNISNNKEDLLKMFSEILENQEEDFVIFDPKSLKTRVINEQNTYNGVRISVKANFDSISQILQIDIGFGDVIIPKPIEISYPILLPDAKVPVLWAYNPETVIAEKLQAIIELAQLNSRMKDFYDIYTLLTTQKIDKIILKEAITQTFTQRGTTISFKSVVFTPEFYKDSARIKMWNTFLKKIKVDEISFKEVVKTIKKVTEEISQ